jgi:hypothetical protein
MTDGAGPTQDATTRQLAASDCDRPAEIASAVSPRAWTPPPETALGRARRLARFMPLIEAWTSAGPGRPALDVAERDLLTVVQLSVRRGTNLLIRLPGGVHRVPLLAAAMIAAESLDVPQSELNRLSGTDPPPGPVALVTTRIVRRSELDLLDASSVPVAPALHPHRLRGDGLASPVRGGQPRLVTGAARLLFVAPTTGFPAVLGVAPRVVIIDAAAEPACDWLPAARSWASAHGSIVITIADLHEEIASPSVIRDARPDLVPATGHAGIAARPSLAAEDEHLWIVDWPWLARIGCSYATEPSPCRDDAEQRITAQARGRAHLLAVEDASLAGLAEVRERLGRLRDPRGRPAPWPVCRAARLTRLLTELPTRVGDYDRVVPRYGGRTLRRLLDDVLDADACNDFPASWRPRVAADWGAVRAILTAAHDALAHRNPLTEAIADLVEDAYRRGQQLDIACGSRSARDALTGRLVSSGTLRIEDPPLVTIRSISSVEASGSHEATLLIGPPAARWRQRLTAADLGRLTVLGTSADSTQIYRSLRSAYSDPGREEARNARCATLAALTDAIADENEANGDELRVGLTTQIAERSPAAQLKLPDPSALVAAALMEPPGNPGPDLADLEAEPANLRDFSKPDLPWLSRRLLAVPVIVRSTAMDEAGPPTAFLLAMAARVQRLRDDKVQLLPVTQIAAGMTLIGISEPERRTLFDRIRPLLAEQRPHVAALLLQLWRVAFDDALAVCGSIVDLAGRLGELGAEITSSAVAQWSDPRRIGPEDQANVARIGQIADSSVVVGEAARIAAVMRAARAHHAAVGSALVRLAGWHASGDGAALDRAADRLGAEVTDLAADLTAWRVVAIGAPVLAPASALRRPMRIDEATQTSQPAGALPDLPDDAGTADVAFLFSEPLPDKEENP